MPWLITKLKLVIFDGYLNTGSKNEAEVGNYYTDSRNKNCYWIGSLQLISDNNAAM